MFFYKKFNFENQILKYYTGIIIYLWAFLGHIEPKKRCDVLSFLKSLFFIFYRFICRFYRALRVIVEWFVCTSSTVLPNWLFVTAVNSDNIVVVACDCHFVVIIIIRTQTWRFGLCCTRVSHGRGHMEGIWIVDPPHDLCWDSELRHNCIDFIYYDIYLIYIIYIFYNYVSFFSSSSPSGQ